MPHEGELAQRPTTLEREARYGSRARRSHDGLGSQRLLKSAQHLGALLGKSRDDDEKPPTAIGRELRATPRRDLLELGARIRGADERGDGRWARLAMLAHGDAPSVPRGEQLSVSRRRVTEAREGHRGTGAPGRKQRREAMTAHRAECRAAGLEVLQRPCEQLALGAACALQHPKWDAPLVQRAGRTPQRLHQDVARLERLATQRRLGGLPPQQPLLGGPQRPRRDRTRLAGAPRFALEPGLQGAHIGCRPEARAALELRDCMGEAHGSGTLRAHHHERAVRFEIGR